MICLTIALLACCAVLQSSASLLSDHLDVDELYKQLHDPAKGKIDIDCETCFLVVDVIQFLVQENRSEDEIADAITELCISLQIEDQLVCSGIVPEFKVRNYIRTKHLAPPKPPPGQGESFPQSFHY